MSDAALVPTSPTPSRAEAGWQPTASASAAALERGLLARLRAGDAAAFEELVRTAGPRLLSTTRRMLRNEEDARDAVQEAFLSAFRALGGFDGECQLATWLHRIAVNAALMKMRRCRRRPEASIEELLPTFDDTGHHLNSIEPWRPEPLVALERAEVKEAVRAAIDRLPEAYRTVLLLRDIEEMSTEETARVLGVTENAVKVRLHRARQALRTLLDPIFQ
jgi:RNA polymerase sigma-70 factor (ECF subfamily)